MGACPRGPWAMLPRSFGLTRIRDWYYYLTTMAVATSLKLPDDLKARVDTAAEAAGKTSHAFMVEAIERETDRAERYQRFVQDALDAEREMDRSGVHYAAEDVFRYATARAQGKPARRPKPRPWQK